MGLDPRLEQIPEYIRKENDTPSKIIAEFNKELIDIAHDLIPVIKPQIAFYEKYDALDALKTTINHAKKKDLLVILDAKRNDIGTTSAAYADSCFDVLKTDACTVNAYFGIDGIKPFMEYDDKGLFILVKTSNPSSGDFQNLFSVRLDTIPDSKMQVKKESITLERNYIQMARLVKKWSQTLETVEGYHNLGVVVGATYPEEMKAIRKIVDDSFILIPGYGAQGANAKDIKFGFDQNGLGGIVNSSRSIIYAYEAKKYPSEKFAEAARKEIMDMNQNINAEIGL